ncbi:hypothetical protein C8R43DRAFT_1112020 [Mycena crocata]|nr:hypothetical protein C8R43DRAFT_1112020 [Mycena crocata]
MFWITNLSASCFLPQPSPTPSISPSLSLDLAESQQRPNACSCSMNVTQVEVDPLRILPVAIRSSVTRREGSRRFQRAERKHPGDPALQAGDLWMLRNKSSLGRGLHRPKTPVWNDVDENATGSALFLHKEFKPQLSPVTVADPIQTPQWLICSSVPGGRAPDDLSALGLSPGDLANASELGKCDRALPAFVLVANYSSLGRGLHRSKTPCGTIVNVNATGSRW